MIPLTFTKNQRQNGFSLVELSIVLAVIGAMFLAIPAIAPTVQNMFVAENDAQTVAKSNSAIKGFLKAQGRFPCPDSTGDGDENCAANVQSGRLPYKTLKLASPVINSFGQPIAYSVYRNSNSSVNLDADLASLKNRFSPLLPNSEVSNVFNGLDFCWALKTAINTPATNSLSYVGTSATPINQAYVIASPGGQNADDTGGFFDGSNQQGGVGFELPDRRIDAGYDDTVYSVGFAQLAGELNCSTLLGKVNGAARTAFAMHDISRVIDFTVDFRTLAVSVHDGNVDQAEFNEILAILNAAIYVGQTVIAIAAGAESFGAAVAAIAIPAVLAGALTTKGLIDTVTAVTAAKDARAIAASQLSEAQAQKQTIDALYTAKLAKVKSLDAKGWFQ